MAYDSSVTLSSIHGTLWVIRSGKILMLLSLITIVFLTPDFAWARKRLKYRHTLMIGAGFFGDASKFGYEGLCFDYQYDVREYLSISLKPAFAFPDEQDSYYSHLLAGINWRPFGGVLPRRKSKSFGSSPYLGLCFGFDYFWTDPVSNNIEIEQRFGLMPSIGIGYSLLSFSHFLFDIYAGLGLSWRLFGGSGDTFIAQQDVRISFGMKF